MSRADLIFRFAAVLALLSFGSAGAFGVSVPAAGKHEIVLPIAKWGRYSLRSSGDQPVALAIADRRNGGIGRDGDAGRRHGRLDLFLDRGEYRLTVQGPKKAASTATVTATPFAFPEGFKPAYLLPLRENRLELDDLQQAAFWFEAEADTVVYMEAVGRNLADLVLWRDGEWLVRTGNGNFTAKPRDETPLNGISLAARIPKGRYMVGAYGGKGRPWAVPNGEHPFFLRMGIPPLAANVAAAMTLPATGYSQVLLAAGVTEVVVEAPDKKRLRAEVTRLERDFGQAGWLATDSISGKSNGPRMLLHAEPVPEAAGHRMLKITGAPGQAFTLKTFAASKTALSGREGGAWWVSSLHSGNPEDNFGASAAVIERTKGAIVALQADTVSGERELAKRFNLVADVNAFLWVGEDGKYAVTPGGTGYSWRLRRYFHTRPPNHVEPEWNRGAKTLALNQGLHVLDMAPVDKGIATLVIAKASVLGGMIAAGKAAVGAGGNRAWNAPRPAVRFPRLAPGPKEQYDIELNVQGPELSALSARPLPLDPDQPLGLWCRPGEAVEIPVRLAGRRILEAADARGVLAPLEIDGRRFETRGEAEAGDHKILLPGSGEARRLILKSVPVELAASGPPPAFPDAKLNAEARFPAVVPEKTVFLDLDRNGERPYAVRVSEPGLYRIETTGRLATSLSLSDRFLHFTREAQANGVGRNALLIEYLLPGEYRLAVAAVELSAGRAGLAVYRNALAQGGSLEPDIDNRKFIERFSGAEYRIAIPAAGRYRIESIGQRGAFPIRLEDKDGWPVEPALVQGPLQAVLPKGSYRLISLPTDQEGRRITRLVPLADKGSIKGKGPHPLVLNARLASTWVESRNRGDTSEAPARFVFSLPAALSARLSISEGFQGALYREGPDSLLFSWSGEKQAALAMGRYRLDVAPKRKRNHAPYQVSVSTRELAPGLAYELRKNQTLAVGVGSASIVEFGSQGLLDVSATLLDGDGKTVLASSDDGYLDWNFSLSRALKAGRYFLRVESAEPAFTSTTVFMRALADTAMDTLSAAGGPLVRKYDLGRRIAVLPLAPGDKGDIIACAARSRSRTGLAIEKREAGSGPEAWIPIAQAGGSAPSLSIPRAPGARYRAKLWSEGAAEGPTAFTYASVTARYASWKEAEAGLAGQSESLGGSAGKDGDGDGEGGKGDRAGDYRAWFKIDLESHAPGHFRALADANRPLAGIGVSTAPDSVFFDESAAWFASTEQYAWIELRFEQAGKFRVKLDPMVLENGRPLTVDLIGNRPRVFGTRIAKGSVALLSAETDGGHPLAAVPARPETRSRQLKVRGLAVDPALWIGTGRGAAFALPEDERRAVVWNALPPLDGVRPAARLTWTELPLAEAGGLEPGVVSWSASRPAARVFHLPPGAATRLRVTLPPEGAAFLKRRDAPGTLEYASGNDPLVREFLADGGDLYLLAPKAGARFDVAAFALSSRDRAPIAAEPSLAPGAGWQAELDGEGETLLPLAADKPFNLYYRGAVRGAEWIGGDGLLRTELADGALVGPGGFLRLGHVGGWARMNLCPAGSGAGVMACKWGASLAPAGAADIAKSSLVRLREGLNWYTFSLADTQHVNLSAPLPLAAILLAGGVPVHYQEAWGRFNWDLPLPPGKYALGIHSLAGAGLEGGPLSVLFRAIAPLSEKRPFTAFMGPGESRLLAFEAVKRPGAERDTAKKARYGIGLRMARETAQVRLYDAKGGLVEQGKQQFVALEPGRYYLWLRVPEGEPGTEVTANLFGQEPPPNEPPEKLVKWILNGAEGPRPDPGDAGEAEPENPRPAWERFLRSGYGQDSGEGSGESSGEGGDMSAANAGPEAEMEAEAEAEGEGMAAPEDGNGDASGDGESQGE